MVMIFGGVYQGKLEYALTRFGLSKKDVCFCADGSVTRPAGKKIIYEIDKWILALIKEDINISEETEKFLLENHDAIIICNDISCGVVPIDPVTRRWREEAGRFLGLLAQQSDNVIRLYCGIPIILKGA